jgi:hypothetical protein|tara:strand:- start:1517 stop:2122 length:606 start_codon:yes stop_codon:yes gene_type:complete
MKNISIVLVCLFVSFDIFAQVVRQKDSHEHGAAIIKMVMEEEKLQVEFEVPSESLIGFEHYPKSQSKRENFNKAIKILSDPSKLFSKTTKAECILVGMNVSQSLFSHEEEHGDEAEEEHGHDESEKEEEHGHDVSEKSEIHSEFKSNYYWNCQHLDEIDSIGTQLMTFFPQIEEIRVNWISNNGQGSLELESKDDRIKGWK